MIDECKKAKDNCIAIEAAFPGITNYEAVKKYLQRLKKKANVLPFMCQILMITNLQEN